MQESRLRDRVGRALVLLTYVGPCLLGIALLINSSYLGMDRLGVSDRLLTVADAVCDDLKSKSSEVCAADGKYLTRFKSASTPDVSLAVGRHVVARVCEAPTLCEGAPVDPRTRATPSASHILGLEAAPDGRPIAVQLYEQVRAVALSNAVYTWLLALAPFLILGWGFSGDTRLRQKPLPTRIRDANHILLSKFGAAYITAWGVLYLFHPYGLKASLAYETIRFASATSVPSSKLFFQFVDGPHRHILVGFFGWYVQVLGYFFYRYYNQDCRGTKMFGSMFQRAMLVFGVSMLLSVGAPPKPGEGRQDLLLIFMLGFLPSHVVYYLKEAIGNATSAFSGGASLSLLPAMSTWRMMRLHEEGIHEIADMATADVAQLIEATNIDPRHLQLWHETAVLFSIVGQETFEKLRSVCLSAGGFTRGLTGPGSATFRATLVEAGVANPDVVAELLAEYFDVAPGETPASDAEPAVASAAE